MFDMKLWVYNFLIPLVFLADRQGCSTADDFSFEATFEPEDFIQQRLEDFSTKSSISGDELEDNDNFNIIGSKSIEVDAQKFNNGAIYPEIVLSERNQLQRKKDNEQNNAGDGTEYLTAIGSNSSKEWVTSHKKLARSTFEKHRAHHRNFRRYGHKSHKKNFAKYRKYEHSRTRKHPGVRNSFNHHPYYQGQVSYYGDTDTIDDSIYTPAKMRSHRYHHHGHHISRMDEYNRNSKWPHLSRVQYQLYEDEKEDDLPPYIKKYNRRNKQLLDLLEGTMPPPTPPQAADELLNKKREKSQRRYHNHKNPKWIMEDLFEEQRANPNNPNSNTDEDQYVNDSASPNTSPATADTSDEVQKLIQQNELPGDDFSISAEEATDKRPEESGLQQNGNSMRPHQPDAAPASTSSKVAPKGNKFIYHRVDAPRVVGAGIGGPKKQRLPFVAITDRRLETSKMRQKNFEQNHLPLP